MTKDAHAGTARRPNAELRLCHPEGRCRTPCFLSSPQVLAMKLVSVLTILILMVLEAKAAEPPVPKALLEAKQAFVVNAGAEPPFYERLVRELTAWMRFELVEDQARSDITISLKHQGHGGLELTIVKSDDKSPLWHDSAKWGISTDAAAHLVSRLRKRLESAHDAPSRPTAELWWLFSFANHNQTECH
jgi:hypothetical protein